MTTIRSVFLVSSIIVLSASLSAMQDELSLRNLCLKTIANHPQRNTPILSDGSSLVDQTISAIATGKLDDVLKLKMAKALSKDDIEPYRKDLWDYVKTLDTASIPDERLTKNATTLLLDTLIGRMPEEFLKKHLHELVGLPTVSFAYKCALVEKTPFLQTPPILKSLCSQGPVTEGIAKLIAEDGLRMLSYKQGEYYQADMRAHGNEQTLLRAFFKDNVVNLQKINPPLQFREDGSAWLIFESEIIHHTESGEQQKIETTRHEYPIDSLDKLFAILIFADFTDYADIPRQEPASLNPGIYILESYGSDKIDHIINMTKEAERLIDNNEFDELSISPNIDLELSGELALTKIFLDEIPMSEIPQELLELYNKIKNSTVDAKLISVRREMEAVNEQLEPHILTIASITQDYIGFNRLQCVEKEFEQDLSTISIPYGGPRLLGMYQQIQENYRLDDAVAELSQAVESIEALATKFYRPQAAQYRKIIDQLISFLITFDRQYRMLVPLLECGPTLTGSLHDIDELQELFQNLISAVTHNRWNWKIDQFRRDLFDIKRYKKLQQKNKQYLERLCNNVEKFNQLLAEFKQQPLLSCFTDALTYFELYQSKVIPYYIKAKNDLDYPKPEEPEEEQPRSCCVIL